MRMQEIQSTLAVVRCQSYAEAAECTHQATSTVSKHVQRVEQELGVRLFERGGRQDVELTDRGKVVLPYLRLLADDYEKMQEYAREYARQQARNLSIGYSPLVGTTGESEILANFQARCPEACVTHVLMENADLWQLLKTNLARASMDTLLTGIKRIPLQRKLDGAFFFTIGRKSPINAPWYGHLEPNLGSKMIYRSSRLYIGVGENHRFASRTSILAEELEDETCIFNSVSGHMAKDMTNLIFNMVNGETTQIPFHVRYMSFAYRPAVYALIREGLGVLPQGCIPPTSVKGIRFIPVSNVSIDARAKFVYWKNSVPRIMNGLLAEVDAYAEGGVKNI